MAHLGRRFPSDDANKSSNASRIPVLQIDVPALEGELLRPDTTILDSNPVNIQVAPSYGSRSMTAASNSSSPKLPRTPIVGLSTPTQAGRIPRNCQVIFDRVLGDEPRISGFGAPSQNFGDNAQTLHSHCGEQLGEPLGWLADINFHWDGEIDAAVAAFDSDNPLAKDLNEAAMRSCEKEPAMWKERSTSPRFAI